MLIGFVGYARSGKSTAATFLQDSHGFERARIAGPLKDMLRAVGLTDRELEGDRKEAPLDLLCGRTPREAMVTLGTEWGRRMIGGAFWANAWLRRVEELGDVPIAVEDVRFPNEAEAVRALGGVIVRIENPQVRSRARWGLLGRLLLAAGFRFSIHPFERTDRIRPDHVLWNDGLLEDLETRVDALPVYMGAGPFLDTWEVLPLSDRPAVTAG